LGAFFSFAVSGGGAKQEYLTVKVQHKAKCDLSDCGTFWTCVLTRWEFVDQL